MALEHTRDFLVYTSRSQDVHFPFKSFSNLESRPLHGLVTNWVMSKYEVTFSDQMSPIILSRRGWVSRVSTFLIPHCLFQSQAFF